jgi:hypothetical protein
MKPKDEVNTFSPDGLRDLRLSLSIEQRHRSVISIYHDNQSSLTCAVHQFSEYSAPQSEISSASDDYMTHSMQAQFLSVGVALN